ncbi:MAG: hypothetical protein HON23_02210 [Rickettsiales bacterium]|jgi:hypothetical protein|nr:hypothetical protein [Rickettsiales bacterium]
MDLFDEVKKEVERDRLKGLAAKYYKHFISGLAIFVIIIISTLLYKNYQTSLSIKSYISYTTNSASGFESDINLTTSHNAVDIIHFINKYSYLSSSGDNDSAKDLLSSLNYNQVTYEPFREILYLYDDNREGSSNQTETPIFQSEAQFITAINLIKKGDLESAYNLLNDLSGEPDQAELLKTKATELKKIIKFKLDEQKS